jgi:thiol-disulfide isomerase/thioredoxin
MTPQDEHTIRDWASRQTTGSGTIGLALTTSAASAQMDSFCHQLQLLAKDVALTIKTADHLRKPSILLGPRHNIVYQAIPQAAELELFLEAITPAGRPLVQLKETLVNLASSIALPVELVLYIAPQCPYCPKVARQLLGLARINANLQLTVIDVTFLPELAQLDHIRSVPTLLLADVMRWTGELDLHDVLAMCRDRDTAMLSTDGLRQLIASGAAAQVARMMVERQVIFPALVTLLVDPKWPVRLGAMVTVEYLAEADPQLTLGLADPLWQRFTSLEAQIQGDVAHVLGLIPPPLARHYLHQIVQGPYAKPVREAAVEALEEITGG